MAGPHSALYRESQADFFRMRNKVSFTGEKPSWLLYMIVGVFALLKDMLDIVFGVFPGLGTVVSLTLGFGFSVIIFLLLSIFDRSGAGSGKNRAVAKQFTRRFITLLGTLLVDILPIVNFLPVTTLSIMILYWLAKRDWKRGQRTHQKELRQMQRMLYA
jgi:hypothetical protein